MAAYLCPQPGEWDRVHTALKRASAARGIDAASLPVPLILNGWWYSNDEEKRARWNATVNWAASQELSTLLPVLDETTGYLGENG